MNYRPPLPHLWHKFWALSWWWKGPSLAGVGLVVLIVIGLVAGGGGDNKSDSEVRATSAPATTLASRTSTTTPKPTEASPSQRTTTATAAPTQPPSTTAPLLTASDKNLLTLADLPSGWSLEDSDPRSSIADPSAYSACGASPSTPLDVGFSLDAYFGEFV